jgi:hypothetical protein
MDMLERVAGDGRVHEVWPGTDRTINRETKGSFMGDHAEWKDLVGRQVRILKTGRTIRTGQVEAVTVAADALWIEAHGIEPRALYEKAQGHRALPVSRKEDAARERRN